jgi:DNA-binding response OmpR family regulator
MSGYEVCRTIRSRYSREEMPVIFLSVKDQLADLTAGFEIGANDYLAKPIAREELVARVRGHLEMRGVTRSLQRDLAAQKRELDAKDESIVFARERLRLRRHLAAVGEAGIGAAREVVNPLSEIQAFSAELSSRTMSLQEVLQSWRARFDQDEWEILTEHLDEIGRGSRIIHGHGERAVGTMENVLTLFQEGGNAASVPLNQVVSTYAKLAFEGHVPLVSESVSGVEEDFDQSLENLRVAPAVWGKITVGLMENAITAMEKQEQGSSRPVHLVTMLEDDMSRLGVRDSGVHPEPRSGITLVESESASRAGMYSEALLDVLEIVESKLDGTLEVRDEGNGITGTWVEVPKEVL